MLFRSSERKTAKESEDNERAKDSESERGERASMRAREKERERVREKVTFVYNLSASSWQSTYRENS